MRRFWKFWCNKVDERNERLTYGDYGEEWSYYEPIFIILYGMFFSLIAFLLFRDAGMEMKEVLLKSNIIGLLAFAMMAYGSYISWKSV